MRLGVERKERAKEIVKILKKEYPDAQCSLHFSNPLELLIATILSAQCTDERVNKVTQNLFKKYKSAHDYSEASQTELEKDIHSTGFYKNKAKNIRSCCKDIAEKHQSKVPQTMEELTQLAGIGRKTANVILGNIFEIPGLVVDTHVKRLSHRMGLTKQSDPVKIEFDLHKIIPEKDWTNFSHLLIHHGRKICTARKAKCDICCVNKICPKII
ncbi:MAG: endonuclease III [Deltaproteobacteria bacterium]|nr:endonuclease III [Deltaproteobacteria bacterium]